MKAKTGTREWSDVSINCCLGCANACLYCYGREIALRTGRIKCGADWARERPRILGDIERDPKFTKKHRGVVMFPTTHDITDGNRVACMVALSELLAAGNNVLLVTKPHLRIMPDIRNIWRAGAGGGRLEVRCSITCLEDSVRRAWEPHAPPMWERIAALQYLHGRGMKTSVSIEPCLQPERAEEIVAAVERFVTGEIWIGKLNRLRERTTWTLRQNSGLTDEDLARLGRYAASLEAFQSDEQVLSVYRKLKDHPKIMWKDSYREVIERHGLNAEA